MPSVTDDAMDHELQIAVDLEFAARTTLCVLVTASNVGDRAAWARTIHDRSARRDGPFVMVCGRSIPAATGKDVGHWFDRAAEGTLFIDRVGALSRNAQGRLLSLVTGQSRDGHRQPRVRIITGSDRSLRGELAIGAFNDTLFYRLNLIHIGFTT